MGRSQELKQANRVREYINSTIDREAREAAKLAEIAEKKVEDREMFDAIGESDEIIQFFKDNEYGIRLYYKNEHGEALIVENERSNQAKAVVLYRGKEQEKFSIIAKNKYIYSDFGFQTVDDKLLIRNIEIISELSPVPGMESVCEFDKPRELTKNLSQKFGIKKIEV